MTLNAKHIWHIIEPIANRNEFTHPLPWTTDGFTAIGGATIETSTERMRNGGPVLKVTGSGVTHTAISNLEAGKWYSFGVDIWAAENSEIRLSISGTSETFKVNGQWRRCDMDFQATSEKVPKIEMIAGSGSFYADRFSIQHGKGPWTWFCGFGFDADSAEHFAWEGAPWASASIHTGLDRRAGRLIDLDDLFMVSEAIGFGMAPINLRRTDVLTGGAVPQGYTTESRDFSLIGTIQGKDRVELFQKRKKLSMLIRPDALDGQPLNLLHQFVDATTGEPLSEQVTIECRYKDGLRDAPKYATVADDVITFEAHLGYFYANAMDGYRLGEKVPLESNNVIMKRKTGEWVARPGLDGEVRCLAEDNAGRIWAGGDFTGKIAYSRGDAWQVPKTAYGGIAPNGAVRAIAITPDNQVFFGGDFTTIFDGSSTMTVNRIARLQPTADVAWELTQLVGTGINDGSVHALLIDNMGKLVIGGTFSSANSSTSRGIARYDTVITAGDPWKQYTGFKAGAQIFTLAHSGTANVVCLGGEFESTTGTIENLARLMLDTSTVMSFGSPTRMQGRVDKIAKRPDGSFVIAGAGVGFPSSEYGFLHHGVGQIRGSSTSPLSNHQVVVEAQNGMYNAVIDEDGGVVLFSDANVWVNGTNCGRYPYYKNGAWNRHPEISIITDGGEEVKVNDMLILRNGDTVYAGAWDFHIMVPPPNPAIMPVFTEATAGVYPIIRVFGPNRLHFIRSHKTGKVIFFKDAYVPHGSWLEMSLRRDKIQIRLDWKNALNIIGDGSDYADFTVEPELNLMHVHAQKLPDDPQDIPGDIFVLWQSRFWSLEGSIYGSV